MQRKQFQKVLRLIEESEKKAGALEGGERDISEVQSMETNLVSLESLDFWLINIRIQTRANCTKLFVQCQGSLAGKRTLLQFERTSRKHISVGNRESPELKPPTS